MLGLGRHSPLAVPAALLRLLGLVFKLAEHPCWIAGLIPQLGRFMHLSPDDLPQLFVARQPEHKVHAVLLAPAHQLVAAEAGIAAQNDFHPRPRRPNLRHNSSNFLQTPERGIVIGFPQSRAQNVLAAKDIQRQIAILVVVAVEQPPFLFAVQRQVRGVHVQNNLSRGVLMRFKEHLHQQLVNPRFPKRDLLIAILSSGPQFHPVQSALTRQRFFQLLPTSQDAEDRIVAQLFVIVDVFITKRQTVDSLGEHLLNGMFDLVLIPAIEKTLGQARQQIQTLVGLAQQERTAV